MGNKTLLVAQREYVEHLRTKAFWIGIFFFPLILLVMTIVPALLEKARDVRHYAVVDDSGWLLEAVRKRASSNDLKAVLSMAVKSARVHSKAFERYPEPLRNAASEIEQAVSGMSEEQGPELESELAGALAAEVAGANDESMQAFRQPEHPQHDVYESLRRSAPELKSWWGGLLPSQVTDFGADVSAAKYVMDPVQGTGAAEQERLNKLIADEEIFAYFVIGPDPVKDSQGSKYVSGNLTDEDLRKWFSRMASEEIRERRLAQEDIDKDVAQWLQSPLNFELKKVSAGGAEEEVSDLDQVRQWAPVVFVYLLWIAVFSISQGLLTSTIEEKSNRIIEVLLSSVSPLQLMIGKILGIAATGLTVVLSWVVLFLAIVEVVPPMMGAKPGFDLASVVADPVYLASFLVYFLLAYLFYSALLVAIGSACNSLKEAQNLMMPVTIMLLIPLMLMVPISKDPNGTIAKVMSYVPPFTAFVMVNRAAAPPSLFEYIATTILLLAAIFVALWGAAKIFRIGILMTGKAPNLPELLKWIRAPVGQVPTREDRHADTAA